MGLLAAGLDGVERGLRPGEAQNDNLFLLSPREARARGIELLPSNLGEALDALEQDDLLCSALGTEYAQHYLEVKREEWDDYAEMTAKSVTAWEIGRYLGL